MSRLRDHIVDLADVDESCRDTIYYKTREVLVQNPDLTPQQIVDILKGDGVHAAVSTAASNRAGFFKFIEFLYLSGLIKRSKRSEKLLKSIGIKQ